MAGVNQRSGSRLALMCLALFGLPLCLAFPTLAAASSYEEAETFGGVRKAGEVNEESQLVAWVLSP